MMKIENGQVLRKNETDLFHTKEIFADFDNFEKKLAEMPQIKNDRESLRLRITDKQSLKTSIDGALKNALGFNPKKEKYYIQATNISQYVY